MEILTIFILVLIGLILITLEVLFLPGLIVGILGGLLILSAIIYSTITLGFQAGIITVIGSLLAAIGMFLIFKKLKVWNRFILQNEQKASIKDASNFAYNKLIGKRGIALTDLKPSGFIIIDDKKIDVQTSGEFIPKNSIVEIISVEGIKIVVKKVEEKQ